MLGDFLVSIMSSLRSDFHTWKNDMAIEWQKVEVVEQLVPFQTKGGRSLGVTVWIISQS